MHTPNRRKVYVASSWRNNFQPSIVGAIREDGHEVYDFRHPAPGNTGFAWSEIDPDWMKWTPLEYAEHVRRSTIAAAGFALDKAALDWCDTCVLVLPSGRSAHIEAGYAAGQGKRVIVYLVADGFEPELMYLLCDGFAFNLDGLLLALRVPAQDLSTYPACEVG